MEGYPARSNKIHFILGILTIGTSCISATVADAAPPTNVNPAPLIQNPYQQMASIPDSASCAPQCIAKFPVVPSGKRLVVTDVSAQMGPLADFVIAGNGISYFIQKPYAAAEDLNTSVAVYFEAGSMPTARFFVQNASQHTSLIVTFVGYLIPPK
jgi:hypothetical protein